MNTKTVVAAMALGISLVAARSTEAEILVSCVYRNDDNSPCFGRPQQATIPTFVTWYIPAIGENEPEFESAMQISLPDFNYSTVSINGGPSISRPGPDVGGFFNVKDPDGSLSDVVTIFPNDVPVDNRIIITSDPDAGSVPTFMNLGTLATEGDTGATGATMTLSDGIQELHFNFRF